MNDDANLFASLSHANHDIDHWSSRWNQVVCFKLVGTCFMTIGFGGIVALDHWCWLSTGIPLLWQTFQKILSYDGHRLTSPIKETLARHTARPLDANCLPCTKDGCDVCCGDRQRGWTHLAPSCLHELDHCNLHRVLSSPHRPINLMTFFFALATPSWFRPSHIISINLNTNTILVRYFCTTRRQSKIEIFSPKLKKFN